MALFFLQRGSNFTQLYGLNYIVYLQEMEPRKKFIWDPSWCSKIDVPP